MILGIICLLILMSLGRVGSHVIVVVEYKPITDSSLSPEEILMKNADEYIKIIKDVSKGQNISVIVFPEATLDNAKTSKDLPSYAIRIRRYDRPCSQDKKYYPLYFQKLICTAYKYRINVVINLIENDDNHYYTSDVVVDHFGQIKHIVRRESRVGVPALKNPPIPFPDKLTFKVSTIDLEEFLFGVTSFVRAFSFSEEKMLSKDTWEGSPYYLICSNWISELPFLTSFQVLQMWSHMYGLFVFMSGANNPEKGQGGTGIFGLNTPVLMDFSSDGSTRVHIFNLSSFNAYDFIESPAIPEKTVDELAKEMDEFNLAVDPDLFRYESMVVDHDQTQIDQILCYNKNPNNTFCCEFHLGLSFDNSLKKNNYYTYHLVAYKGYKTYHDIFEIGGIEVCAVIACLDSSLTSCGKRFKKYDEVYWPLTFQQLTIKGKFGQFHEEDVKLQSIQFPNSLLSSLRPIHPNLTNFTYEIVQDENDPLSPGRPVVTFLLMEPLSKILTFGIFGRNFTLVDPRPSSASLNLINLLVIFSGFIIILT